MEFGTTAKIHPLASDETEVADLENRQVVPGFQDSHIHHIHGAANIEGRVRLEDSETLEEIQRRVAEYAGANPDKSWIAGHGWGYAAFPHNTLDAASGTFQEDIRGTLTAGTYADFVVLSRDILEIDPEISETEVLLTVTGGKNTYRSKDF